MNTTILIIAAEDLYRAARRNDTAAWDDASLALYDYANEFGRGDVAEAVEALPETPDAAAAWTLMESLSREEA